MSGQAVVRTDISNITTASRCVVTTSTAHGLTTNQFARLTDLNGRIPIPRGMDPINDGKFRVVVIDTTNFYIQDPITFKDIDSTNYTPYVTGGSCNLVQNDFTYNGDS